MEREAVLRLTVALVVSAALHGSLVFGIAARPAAAPPAAAPVIASLVPLTPSAAVDDASGRLTPGHRVGSRPRDARGANVARRPDAVDATVAAAAFSPAQSALPTAALPVPVDAAWYTPQDLDILPKALAPIRAMLPAEAAGGEASTALLLVRIDETGRVEEARPADADVDSAVARAAVSAVSVVPFTPAQRGGHAVRSRVLLRVTFDSPAAATEITGASQ